MKGRKEKNKMTKNSKIIDYNKKYTVLKTVRFNTKIPRDVLCLELLDDKKLNFSKIVKDALIQEYIKMILSTDDILTATDKELLRKDLSKNGNL